MALLDHSTARKDGRPHMVLCDANIGDIRRVKLPEGPLKVSIGPALAADGLSESGTLVVTVREVGALTDSAAQVAVADDANRWLLGAGKTMSWVVSGLGEVGISHSIAAGYTQIVYERAGV